jgi:hypothetical protein
MRTGTDSLLTSFRSILIGQNIEATASASGALRFQEQVERARAQFELLNPLKEKNFTFFIETVFEPIEFDQYRFTPNRLESAAQRAHIDFVGWPFLFFHHNRRDVLPDRRWNRDADQHDRFCWSGYLGLLANQ